MIISSNVAFFIFDKISRGNIELKALQNNKIASKCISKW